MTRPTTTSGSTRTVHSRPGQWTLTLLLAELAGYSGQHVGRLHPTGWLLLTLGIRTFTHLGPTLFILHCSSPTFPGHVWTHSSTPGQVSHQGDSLLYFRFLQPDLSRTQEVRRLKARHRPQCLQQVSSLPAHPDGDDHIHHALTPVGTLHGPPP